MSKYCVYISRRSFLSFLEYRKENYKNQRRNDELKQEYLDALKKLRPIDNDFMKVIFKDQRCVELLLDIIYDHQFYLVKFHVEDEHKNLEGRSVRMDIVAHDERGRAVDIEMEKSIDGASPLRARYHASILDSSVSYPAEKWQELPDIYVIFICEEDVFKTGELVNPVQRYMNDKNIFDDKVHIIYINANIQDETPLGKLMHDLMCKNPEEMYYEALRRRVGYFKNNEGGKKVMCDVIQKLVEEEKKKAEEQGEERGEKRGELKKIIQLLMKKFPGYSFEWVKECNEEQLNIIDDNIIIDISYNDFYKLIHS